MIHRPERPARRIVAWNVGHQARKPWKQQWVDGTAIPALIATFDQPDIIVLTEYVESEYHLEALRVLDDANYRVHTTALRNDGVAAYRDRRARRRRHNGVLIATRMPSCSITADRAGPHDLLAANLLHVSIPRYDDVEAFELVGFKREEWRPKKLYGEPRKRKPLVSLADYWTWIAGEIHAIKSPRVIAIGDFNLDPADWRSNQRRLTDVGYFHSRFPQSRWTVPMPTGDNHSFYGLRGARSRLDHALVSSAFVSPNAIYVAEQDYVFGGLLRKDSKAMSDHAVLVLDITLK